jgi:hypothetical protein
VALGFAPVLEASFDIERARHRAAIRDVAVEAPVFVTGLARAGTSILTRLLEAQGPFASLTYRDMPFPLAPNSWRRLSGRLKRSVETRERGHGDGLTHDLDSPEAIEEVFWRAHEGERYLTPAGLKPVPPAPETIASFRDYVRLVLLGNPGKRYLSKNNNNVLRLPALIEAFPDAVLLHPFRDPVQQAESLRAQHLRAIALAAGDGFRRSFMGWLGHHEFGADQRPFLFAGAPGPKDDPLSLAYWLKAWISVHEALLDQPGPVAARQVFIDHDRLCAEAGTRGERFGRIAGTGPLDLSALTRPSRRSVAVSDPELLAHAHDLHCRLAERYRAVVAA